MTSLSTTHMGFALGSIVRRQTLLNIRPGTLVWAHPIAGDGERLALLAKKAANREERIRTFSSENPQDLLEALARFAGVLKALAALTGPTPILPTVATSWATLQQQGYQTDVLSPKLIGGIRATTQKGYNWLKNTGAMNRIPEDTIQEARRNREERKGPYADWCVDVLAIPRTSPQVPRFREAGVEPFHIDHLDALNARTQFD